MRFSNLRFTGSRILLIASTFGYSWLGTQIVHELGHVLAACVAGERIQKVVLHPLAISRTDVSHDRHPLLVVWGGPIVGVLLPLVALAAAKLLGSRLWYLFQFFAGFCLIVNGVYLGVGLFEGVGDAGDLLRYGSPHWTLISFGLVCTSLGLWLWNGLGLHFELGDSNGRVNPIAVRWSLALFLIIVMVEVLFSCWC